MDTVNPPAIGQHRTCDFWKMIICGHLDWNLGPFHFKSNGTHLSHSVPIRITSSVLLAHVTGIRIAWVLATTLISTVFTLDLSRHETLHHAMLGSDVYFMIQVQPAANRSFSFVPRFHKLNSLYSAPAKLGTLFSVLASLVCSRIPTNTSLGYSF